MDRITRPELVDDGASRLELQQPDQLLSPGVDLSPVHAVESAVVEERLQDTHGAVQRHVLQHTSQVYEESLWVERETGIVQWKR